QLRVPGQPDHVEFCRGRRFTPGAAYPPRLHWGDPGTGLVHARWQRGRGHVDLLADLDFLETTKLRDVPHQALARQVLGPNYGRGSFHLVRMEQPLPPWLRLLRRAWPVWLPLLLALAAGRAPLAARTRPGQRRAAVPPRPPRGAARGDARGLLRPPAPARPGQPCTVRFRPRGRDRRTPAASAGTGTRGAAGAGGPAGIPRAHAHPGPDEEPAMTDTPALPPITGDALAGRVAAIRAEVARAFIGQDDVLDQVLVALLAGGHVL